MDAPDLDALRTKEYWEHRYQNEPAGHEFDWFKSYDDLAPWLNGHLLPDDRIVMLGCGNSVIYQPLTLLTILDFIVLFI
jgi:EEF1A lysine methyltransferase 4